MTKQNSINNDFTNNSDGFDVSGGTSKRKLTLSGGDVAVVGSGAYVYTYPGATCTLAKASPASTDITASRAVNTTYNNGDAARSILVIATVRCIISLAAGNAYVQAKSDGSTPPTTVVSGIVGIQSGLLNEDNSFCLMFIVAPNMNYRINTSVADGTVTLGKWFETVF